MNVENKKTRILLIDNKLKNAEAIKRHLDKRMRLPWELVHYLNLEEAEADFSNADLIILELDLKGFQSPKEIFRNVQGKVVEIPIIALTGQGDAEHGLATYVMEAGAADVVIRGRFSHIIDAIEFALIRQDIATERRQESDDSRERDAVERKSEKGVHASEQEKSWQTLRMFMGDYSVDQSNKRE